MSRESASLSACLDGLFENELAGLVVLRSGVVAACNRCFARMIGYAASDDVQGLALAELALPGESRNTVLGLVKPGGCAVGQIGEFLLAGSEAARVACRFTCVQQRPAQEGRPALLVLLLLDVTDHYRLAEEYNKSLLDLEEAKLVQEANSNRLSEALVQLELAEQAKLEKEKLQGVVELAVAAAHELSQPLQAMQNDLFYLRGMVPEGGEEAAALGALDSAMAELEKIVTRFRKVTSCKTTQYSAGVAMLDLGQDAPGEGEGQEG